MRAKRSKDTRLVDKFSKKRDDLAAESQLQRPINPSADDDFIYSAGKEEDDIKARNSDASVV